MTRVSVVVADDHPLFREGLTAIFERHGALEIVGESSSGDEAIAVVGQTLPNVLLLDVSMPGPPVNATIAAVRRRSPSTRIAILTMYDEQALRESLIGAGAHAFWSKSMSSSEVIAHTLALAVIPKRDLVERSRGRRSRFSVLSAREAEVVHLVGAALTNREIATRLGIAEGTVKRHLSSIFEKLGATSRLDAARKAARLGIGSLE